MNPFNTTTTAPATRKVEAGRHKHYTAHVIPHTHWDREWYEPFQVFRARLVDVVDRVFAILEQGGDFPSFTLDGQAIVLEDYLEVRPENRSKLARRVQDKRLHIGPWYVLADEFLVSPEALVRNLMIGRDVCREFGEPMPVGYTPDSFGHISQLPLLLQGFGIDNVVFERGVGDEGERLGGEFSWFAGDGTSRVFAVHLLGTYAAAAALGHRDWELADKYDPNRSVKHVGAVLYGPTCPAPDLPAWLAESFQRLQGGITAYATGNSLILLNGSDHLFPQADLPQVIADLNEAFADVTFTHSDLPTFVAAARRPHDQLEAYRGEFRGSRYQHVLYGVLSTRMYLKQANHAAEMLLERYAEPLSAIGWLAGKPYPEPLLTAAWKLLLKNHPHDSICGCSVDAVHREMMTRYEGVRQLGEVLCRRAVHGLAEPARDQVAVFNPAPRARNAAVTIELERPAGNAPGLVITASDGRPLPTQTSFVERYAAGRSDRKIRSERLRFLAPLLAVGFSRFKVREQWNPPSWHDLGRIGTNGTIHLENPHLAVELAADGAVTLVDKSSATRYPLRLAFEDVADAGDSYDFSPLAGDRPVLASTPARPPQLIENGPVVAAARVEYRLEVPERLCDDRRRRTGKVVLPVKLELALEGDGRSVHLHLELDNRAEDHRLRLLVATDCNADRIWADGHFEVLSRPLRPPRGEGWFQAPQPTHHQRRFVAASDGKRGLAIINRGLPEYEAMLRDHGVELAITLLRSVGWLSRDDLLSRPQGAGPSRAAPEAQCPGRHGFDLALCPFAGNWWEGPLLEEAEHVTAPPMAFVGQAASPSSHVRLTSPLTLTAVKRSQAGSGLIVRVYNPAPEERAGTLELDQAPLAAYRVRLDETRLDEIAASAEIALRLGPGAVETLELHFAKGVTAP